MAEHVRCPACGEYFHVNTTHSCKEQKVTAMANRLLTVEQMAALCQTVHPDFVVVAPSLDRGVFPTFPIVYFHGINWRVSTYDQVLSDEDFLNAGPRRMLEEYSEYSRKSGRTSELLSSRGSTHGDYKTMANTVQATKNVWRCGTNWDRLHSGQKEALELIATKIGRILTGDPGHEDHWKDLSGYAIKGGECCNTYSKPKE